MACVFTYGTLQIPRVVEAVTGRSFPATPAVLEGFACRRLKAHPFPGICPEPAAKTKGTVYFQVDEESLARLDEFEDYFYLRLALPVLTVDGRQILAQIYVVSGSHLDLLDHRPWSLEEFRLRDLDSFLGAHLVTREKADGTPEHQRKG
jgi:gamma-glutamylcyclotransferase (GGCT)/AIG2-like uncharacterized protein YtfP